MSSMDDECIEIDESTTLTAEEWDAYFKEFPDDFVVEGLSDSPRRLSSRGSPRGSPSHRHGNLINQSPPLFISMFASRKLLCVRYCQIEYFLQSSM